MEPIKVVLRYLDGRIIKGYTDDFFPGMPLFHLQPLAGAGKKPVDSCEKDLKAIFFVRDFEGDPSYKERKNFREGDRPAGKPIKVVLKDGEILVGSTLGYNPSRLGFILFPADPKGNNERIFVPSTAVSSITA